MEEKIVGNFIIQIAGKPVENVEKALDVVLKKLKDEKKKFKVIEFEIGEPELDEDTTLYSGFLDLKIKFNEVKELLNFVMDYTPNSIEIEEPTEIELDNGNLSDILNEVSGHILNNNLEVMKLRANVHVLNKQLLELKDKKG